MTTRNNKRIRRPEARETQPPSLITNHVSERGEKKFWTRIGAAWDHEDARGLTLQLELLPAAGGRIVLREPRDEDVELIEEEGAQQRPGAQRRPVMFGNMPASQAKFVDCWAVCEKAMPPFVPNR